MWFNCLNCKVDFKSYNKNRNFCCTKCSGEYKKKNNISIKQNKICPICNTEFLEYPSNDRKFCSIKCSIKGKSPKKSGYKVNVVKTESQIKALKERTLQYYKDTPKEVLEKRWKNIGKANEVHLTEEEIKRLEEYLELGYIKDKKMLMTSANIPKSYKALNNYIRDNPMWWENFNLFKGQLDWKIQKLKPYQFKELLRDLKVKSHTLIKDKWGIGGKTEKRLRTFYNIDISYRKGYGQTYPEKVVETLLSELNIDYIKEVTFKSGRFRVDFLLQNKTIIEVNGDYWHSNPKLYKYETFTDDQYKNYYNDMFKKDWFTLNGFNILYVWEYDIYNNFETVIKQLLNIKQ